MTCAEIMEKLESLSPKHFAENWDNVGLLVGSAQKQVKSCMLALDATDTVIDQAILMEADMLITHHPMIFKPLKKIVADDFTGKRVIKLIQNDISLFAMHTNFDVMGMADEAAEKLGLTGSSVLEITYEDEISKEGIGRVGEFLEEMLLEECAQFVKECFDLDQVRVFGDASCRVKKAAIVPGSGSDYVDQAILAGADVLITGDISHHNGLDAVEKGIAVIDAGHYGLEKIFIPYMRSFLSRELPELQVFEARQQSPFWHI